MKQNKTNLIESFIEFFKQFPFYTYDAFILDYNKKNEIKTDEKEIESIKRNFQKQEILICHKNFNGRSNTASKKEFNEEKLIKYLIKLKKKK